MDGELDHVNNMIGDCLTNGTFMDSKEYLIKEGILLPNGELVDPKVELIVQKEELVDQKEEPVSQKTELVDKKKEIAIEPIAKIENYTSYGFANSVLDDLDDDDSDDDIDIDYDDDSDTEITEEELNELCQGDAQPKHKLSIDDRINQLKTKIQALTDITFALLKQLCEEIQLDIEKAKEHVKKYKNNGKFYYKFKD
jgi:hypothetical protein